MLTAGSFLKRRTALQMACALGYVQVARVPIQAGASVNAIDPEGSNPSTHCTRFCSAGSTCNIISLLLASGDNPTHTVVVDMVPVPALWFSVINNNLVAAAVVIPFTHLDFPSGSSSKDFARATGSGPVKHGNTTILELSIESGLPLDTSAPARATDDDTFAFVDREALGLSDEQVCQLAIQILSTVWSIDRRDIVSCLARLTDKHKLDISQEEIQASSGSIELLEAAGRQGLYWKATFFSEAVRSWICHQSSNEFRALVDRMCAPA
ncbi:hypothetical protein C8J56DRAFT_21207 [Mycena floridula]|nr:hypothetical protein C8J56DRAFT_21207 [Mycena floridula]